jgi:foldase protein PrsA
LNKRIFYISLPIAALAIVGCGGSKGGGSIVATVGPDQITKDDLFRAMEFKTSATVIVDPQRLQTTGSSVPVQPMTANITDGTIGFQTLKELVNQKVLLQMAQDQGVAPSKDEIQQEVTNRDKEQPGFLKDLGSKGIPLDYVRSTFAIQLAQYKLITKGIKISDKEIDDYIKEDKTKPDMQRNSLLYVPERVALEYIVAKDKKDRDTIDAELASGKQFVVVATQYSADQTASQMGYRLLANGSDVTGAYPPKIQEIIKSMGEGGKTSTWYPQGAGFVKFFLERKIPAQEKTADADVRRQISRGLAMQQGSKAIDLDKQLLAKLKAAKVVVTDEAFKAAWDAYDKQLKTQPAATPTPSPTPATPSATPSATPPAAPGK